MAKSSVPGWLNAYGTKDSRGFRLFLHEISGLEGAMHDRAMDLTVTWNAVTQTIDGDPVTITHYQLIAEKDVEIDHPGFGRTLYSVHVRSSVLSMRVPSEFFEAATQYKFEVLAIEESGNQTLSFSFFATQ